MNERMNWSSAQRYCKENFTDLVTVTDNTVNLRIESVLNGSRAWIGLFRDPNFYWSDGRKYSFGYWDDMFNVIDSQRQLCAVASMQRLGKWNFMSCDTLALPFVCYSIPPPGEWFTALQYKSESYIALALSELELSFIFSLCV